ncbi:predicted protein [Naegleria gruberi]|uniref:Predicted protein n=1 Tax=Naegleria gruberi TaxID=5762 RepID=D2W2K5_NAEGR|nr:uncharacterized protein NAEGRDRAFT_54208 [Naegleria gruberi]EFC36729.1 predicted protein [Naegleria gruberi]|eukprot:XP_002669473.1 predicted protein [Naegleria gruberi strain NEG-M]
MTLYWNVLKNPSDSTNHILEFGLICVNAGYCAIGFDHPLDKGMNSIDTMFAYTISGTAYLKDAYCKTKHVFPTIDELSGGTNDYLETNGGVIDGQYHYRWSRKVNTGDSQDATFKNSNVYVSWAYHTSLTSIGATHSEAGQNVQVNFLANSPTETYLSGMIYNSSSPYPTDSSNDSVVTKLIPYDFLGVSYINMFLDLTVGEMIVISVYWALMVIWFSYGVVNQADPFIPRKISSGYVQMIILNYIFLFIPVTRYNVLQALFGISFERSLKFHKWLGFMIFGFATGHGVTEFVSFRDNIPYMFSAEDQFPLFGIIAWLSLGLLLLFSFNPIRRKLYELFLVFHIPLTLVTVTFSIIHGEGWINLLPYMGFSIILMVIDWALRLIIGFGIPTKLTQISYDEDSEVTTCVFEKRFLTFFHDPNHAHYVFVYIPQVSIYQLHPMTISSSVKLENGNHQFICHIKRMEGGTWAAKLAQLAKSKKMVSEYYGVRVEGAYGNLSIPFFAKKNDQKRTIVFIVAGIGATPCNAILTALEDPKYNDPTPYKVYVNFTMRNEATLAQMSKIMQQKPNVECSFYVTGVKSVKKSIELMEKGQDNSEDKRFVRGSRPNYVEYLEKIKSQIIQSKSLEYVSVFACGPSKMMNAVHNAVWTCSDSSCRFELHKEEFEF